MILFFCYLIIYDIPLYFSFQKSNNRQARFTEKSGVQNKQRKGRRKKESEKKNEDIFGEKYRNNKMKTHRLKYAQMMRKRDLYLRPQTTIVQVAYLCYSFVRIFGDSIFGFFNKLTPFTSSFLLFIYCCSFEMWHALNFLTSSSL